MLASPLHNAVIYTNVLIQETVSQGNLFCSLARIIFSALHVSDVQFYEEVRVRKKKFYGDLVYKFKKIIGNPSFSKRIV